MANIRELILSIESDALTFDEKLAALTQVEETLIAMQQQEEDAVQENVDLIVEAIKVMQEKVDAQVNRIADFVPEKGEKGDKGERGLDGRQGVDGKDGRDGVNGRDGKDGVDGISVIDAKIDFDGSLIITLSTGKELNVGEVVAPDLAEKIKLVTSGGAGTVLPSQTGNSGKYLKTDGSVLSWDTVSGGGGGSGTVTSVGGTGTVNGISLSGTVTTSGNLTLGGTLDLSSPPAIGSTAASTGAFTTLSASSTVSGTGFSTYFASPPAIGGTTASTGRFTTVTSTVATGTAPLTVTSTTPVANLSIGGNAATVTNGVYTTDTGTVTNTMLAGSIANAKLSNSAITFGSTSQALGSTVSGLSGVTVDNAVIGGTTPAAGTHTTLNITGTTNQVSSVAVSSDPAAPTAGNLKTFARTIAGGYTAPAFLNATQAVVQLQPAFANKRIGSMLIANGTAPSITNSGFSSFTGTTTIVTTATTSMFTRAQRFTTSSIATAGTFANYYQTTGGYTLGSATTPAYGGFYFVTRFGIADTVASPRTFIGISSNVSTPTNVEPSTLTNVIGVGQGASDTNLKIYYGGSAAQTPIDLGASFPTGTSNTDWYELTLFAPPTSNNTVYYQVIRLNTGDKASGTLTGTAGTALPANTTYLALRYWRTNNATASAVTLAIGGMYIETDY
jgi:hypothetical protein